MDVGKVVFKTNSFLLFFKLFFSDCNPVGASATFFQFFCLVAEKPVSTQFETSILERITFPLYELLANKQSKRKCAAFS